MKYLTVSYSYATICHCSCIHARLLYNVLVFQQPVIQTDIQEILMCWSRSGGYACCSYTVVIKLAAYLLINRLKQSPVYSTSQIQDSSYCIVVYYNIMCSFVIQMLRFSSLNQIIPIGKICCSLHLWCNYLLL